MLGVIFFASCTLRTSFALNNGVGLTPAMGLSTWNHFAANVNSSLLMQIADAFVASGLKAAGYECEHGVLGASARACFPYLYYLLQAKLCSAIAKHRPSHTAAPAPTDINLDDGWADHRLPNGTIVANEAKFPGGLVPVIDYIHSKGLKFGLYTSYTGLTCQGLPGSNGYEMIDASTYASWGVDYLKEDGKAGGRIYRRVRPLSLMLQTATDPAIFRRGKAIARCETL